MSRSPFWPPSEPRRLDPELAEGEGQVVTDHQQVDRIELVKSHRLGDRPTAQVHEGLWLQEQDPAKVDLCLGQLPLEFATE